MSVLSDVEQAAGALAPFSAPVTAVANAVSAVAGIFKPIETDALIQKYQSQYTQTVIRLNDLLALPASNVRANSLADFFRGLCESAGTSAIGLGDDITVPVDYLLALGTIAAAKVRDDAMINELTQPKQS